MPNKKDSSLMTTEDYLFHNYFEKTPQWLDTYSIDKKVTFGEALSGRFVYCLGEGVKGEMVRVFNQSHSSHVFLYAYSRVSRREVEDELKRRYFTGYHSLAKIEFSAEEIANTHFTQHVALTQHHAEWIKRWGDIIIKEPYCLMDIMERDPDRDDNFGSERLAVIFLGGDEIATFDALFGNHNYDVPFAIVLHELGWGGNYDSFGRGGLLEECAQNTNVFPELLMVEGSSNAWYGYNQIKDIRPVNICGQMYTLYQKLKN